MSKSRKATGPGVPAPQDMQAAPATPCAEDPQASPPQAPAGEIPPAPPSRSTKIDTVIRMMRQADGVDVTALSKATGWQVHSVRGAIAGHIKKKLGLTVTTQKVEGRTLYRIEG